MVRVRFDDSSSGCLRGIELLDCRAELVARRPSEVRGVLAAAHAAAAAGSWVGGYVAYEAAAGLAAELRCHEGDGPLVWFGVFDRCERSDLPTAVGRGTVGAVDADWHRAGVEAIRRSIERGDVYQVNLTAQLELVVDDPEHLYRALATAQRSRYCAFIETHDRTVMSASPELFFEIDDGHILTRPMKGTIARGRWPDEDQRHARRLLHNPKDRAENVMIVDLLRNDLGRIALTGSVEVPQLFALERYPTVWQLTSTISARLDPSWHLVDVFEALFPCGSVTGAPKIAAMAAIAALEPVPRGVYCGAIGFIQPGAARARFAVAIRTAVVGPSTRVGRYGSGGGIVWDADPDAELAELQTKAQIVGGPVPPAALLESMRAENGAVRLLELHLDRLCASADFFDSPADRDAIRAAVLEHVAPVGPPARVRLVLWPTGQLELDTSPLPAGAVPVRLALDDHRFGTDDILRFHKTTQRSIYDQRRATRPDADDVVLINHRGEVVETTIANLAARVAGRWLTPPITAGCLPGVARAEALSTGRVVEATLYPADLARAEEIAVLNAVRGWRPAVLERPAPS